MASLYLFLAGLSEVGWAIGLKAPQRLGSIFSASRRQRVLDRVGLKLPLVRYTATIADATSKAG